MRIAVRKAPEGVVGIVHTRCTRVSEGPLVVLLGCSSCSQQRTAVKPTVNFGSRPRVRKSKCPSVCFQWLQLREVHLEVCELQVLVKFALVGT